MTEDDGHLRRKAVSGSKSRPNDRDSGDHIRQAQEVAALIEGPAEAIG